MEQLLRPRDRTVDGPAEHEREPDTGEATHQRHRERLGEHLAPELQIGGAERTLDAEVADPLEDRGGHRVRQREAADDEGEDADAGEQRGEEGRGRAQEPAQLARKLDVDAGHAVPDPQRHRVRVVAVLPSDRGARVEVGRGERHAARREYRPEETILRDPLRARVGDRHQDEAIGRREHPVQDTDHFE